MTYPSPVTPPGWYGDPQSPGNLRYFDGMAWTHHVAGQPAPFGSGYPAAQPQLGAEPTDPLHWIVPLGRTWQSITAGYVALFATVVWFLGPVALGLGVWALRASRQGGGRGRGRAVFAIIVGALSSVAFVALLASQ
jgi:hypothetical protein